MRAFKALLMLALIFAWQARAHAWHDWGHMVVAQVAYLRLTPEARAQVDRLLGPPPENRRPHIHLCAGYYMRETCEKIYDPVTIAVWMDDFRGDSLNDTYDHWHYINYRPIFDGIPARPNVGPLPLNVLGQLNWSINTLRTGTGSDKRDAEVLGFLYHLAGDVHQPMHTATRYTAARPDGDAGGNGFALKPSAESPARSLHFFWDAAAGLFTYESPKRPLDDATRARIRQYADELMRKYPAEREPNWQDTDPHTWVVESNQLARTVAYAKAREGETPTAEYVAEAQRVSGQRIALAGYRLAAVLNEILVRPPAPPQPATNRP